MALTVQNENGTVVDANAYVTVGEFKSFQADRGGNISAFTGISDGNSTANP